MEINTIIIGIIGVLLAVLALLIRYSWLERFAITQPADVQRISIRNLIRYAEDKPTCTISRRVNFFWKIFYMPYEDGLTVKERSDKDPWGTPYMILYHQAFRCGKLVFQEEKDIQGLYLNKLGYALKRDSYPED